MAKSGIHIKPSKRGTFTSAAKRRGKSVQGFASQVMANPDNYSPAMVKKANFARNAAKWKKEFGGFIDNQLGAELIDTPVGMFEFGGELPKKPSLSSTGLAAGKSPEGYSEEQLRIGIDVEQEHTKNNALAMKIAMDHLEEDPQYYTRLPDPEKAAQQGAAMDGLGMKEYGGMLPEYGLGSWLKKNSGIISGVGKLASMIPVVGQVAGPIISGVGTVAGALHANDQAQAQADADQALLDEQAAQQAKLQAQQDRNTRFQNVVDKDQIEYGSSFMENGGQIGAGLMGQPQIIDYSNGQKHGESAIGGIPVDSRGNPSATSKSSAVGLTEKGEVTWNGYVFSDKLTV